jgi:GNAT superfamily N-acetyltransferase
LFLPLRQYGAVTLDIDWHTGPRSELLPLFRLAEDSPVQLHSYLDRGRVLVARAGPALVGELQLITVADSGEIEIKSLAVAPEVQGTGVGRALVVSARGRCRAEGWTRLLVSTAAADTGNLRFYQRVGFRMLSVERDAFTPATGYPEPIILNGIPLRDRVWFSQELDQDASQA